VSENAENIDGIVVVTVVTQKAQDFPVTRFYIVGADGGKTQLAKKVYFEMLEKQSVSQLNTAAIVRATNIEYRAMSYGEFTQQERSKVEWHEWNLENRDATEKVAKLLPLFDEHYFVNTIVKEDEDKVFDGGWVYRKGDVVGFISRFTDNKENLQTTLYEDGSMKYWDQPKKQYVVGMFKHIKIDVGTDLVSTYYMLPELTEEEQFEIVMGTRTEESFSVSIQVYRVDVMGLDCLVHWHIEDDRAYFVEEVPAKGEQDQDDEEEL